MSLCGGVLSAERRGTRSDKRLMVCMSPDTLWRSRLGLGKLFASFRRIRVLFLRTIRLPDLIKNPGASLPESPSFRPFAGFKTAITDNVDALVGQTATVDFTLEVRQVSQQVTVSAEPPLLESATSEIGANTRSARREK